jgi:D-amino-acid dehydrogenase
VRVAVVGGGVVGLATAFFLHERGVEVAVIERDRCGGATSLGNAGWITPGVSSVPLAAPGVVPQALKWMVQPDSPFYIRPRLSPALALWLVRFWRSSTEPRFKSGLQALVTLNAPVLDLFDHYRERGVEFEMHSEGLLFPALSRAAAEKDAAAYEKLIDAGYPGSYELLDGDEARTLEPGLGDAVAAAVFSKDERHVRPETVTKGLAEHLTANGATVLEQTPVESLVRTNGRWRVQTTGRAAIEADAVVLASGVWTQRLLREVGYRLTILSGKGYSITFPAKKNLVRHPAYLSEAKVGVSPFDGGLRLAGTLELTGIDPALRRRRLDALLAAARRYLRDWQDERDRFEWAGLRPVVADGLPVIGPVPGRDGLFVATGHGMVGVTMSAPTGAALAELIVDQKRPDRIKPFGLERFH